MKNNVYQAPGSILNEDEEPIQSYELASRWKRLGAAFIDGIILMIPTMGIMFYMGIFDAIQNGNELSMMASILLSLCGIAVYLILNFKTLSSNGQTLGKKAIGIKVVDLENRKPNMTTLVIKRYGSFVVAGQIPAIGQFLTLVNILLIFGKQKRCIHDHIAKTKVVVHN